jgi:predicted lipid-binding transport protein (Tim44 family)
MEFFDFGTIFSAIAAIVIFIQLRSVLGKRTGSERPPFDPYTAGRQAEKEASSSPDNVVSLPRKRTNGEAPSRITPRSTPSPSKAAISTRGCAVKDADPISTPRVSSMAPRWRMK